MTEKSMVKADLITSIVLITFGIAIMIISLQMPTMADQNQSIFSAPGIVPGFIGAMLILLNFSMLLRSLRRKAITEFKAGVIPEGALSQESTKRILLTIVLCVLYAISLGRIWFPVVTLLFIFLFIVIFEYDRAKKLSGQIRTLIVALVIATVTTALVALVFEKLFLVKLP